MKSGGLLGAAVVLVLGACASTRSVVIVTERPASVQLTDGTPLCPSSPCRWSFSRSACGGPFRSYSPFIGFEVTEADRSFRSPMLRFCELDEGEVIQVPMSADARLTRASIEFIDAPAEEFVERARHLSRARVLEMSLVPEAGARGSGNLKVELELEVPPLKGPSRERRVTTFEYFRHPGRIARHLPRMHKTTLTVGGYVYYFDLGRTHPYLPGSHIENVSDRGGEIRRALQRP